MGLRHFQGWSSSDEASTSKTITFDFTPVAGETIMVVAVAPATYTPVSVGWTERLNVVLPTGSAWIAYTKVSDGTETEFAWTQNGARTAQAAVFVLDNVTNYAGTSADPAGAFQVVPVNPTADIGHVDPGVALPTFDEGLFLRVNGGNNIAYGATSLDLASAGGQIELYEDMVVGATQEDTYLSAWVAPAEAGVAWIEWDATNWDPGGYDALTIWVQTDATYQGAPLDSPEGDYSTFYPDTPASASVDSQDTTPYTLGTRFTATQDGTITHLHWYKQWVGDAGTLTLQLDNETDATHLADKQVVIGTNVGWQTVTLDTPVVVEDGKDYVVWFFRPNTVGYTYELNVGKRNPGPFTMQGGCWLPNAGVTAPTVANGANLVGTNYYLDVTFAVGPAATVTTITFDDGTIGQPQTEMDEAGVYAAGIHGTGINLFVGESAGIDADYANSSFSIYWKSNVDVTSSAIRVIKYTNLSQSWATLFRAHSDGTFQVTIGNTLEEDSGVAWEPDTVYRIDAQWDGTNVTWRVYDEAGTLLHAFAPLIPATTPQRISLGGGGGPANTDSIFDTLRFSDDVRLWDNYDYTPPAPEPLLAYSFGEVSGLTVTDRSGNGYDATLSNEAARDNGALRFDTAGYNLSLPVDAALRPDSLTLAMTVVGQSGLGVQTLLALARAFDSSAVSMYLDNGDSLNAVVRTTGGIAVFNTGGDSLPVAPFDVALTVGPGGCKLFIDGVESGSSIEVSPILYNDDALTDPWQAGDTDQYNENIGSGAFWTIDNLRFYDTELTQPEVAALVGVPVPGDDAAYANVVHEENDLAGDAVDITPSVANGEVGYLGYSKQFSVNAGGTIDFAVDGLLATDIDIYRLGHYGGAGKRLVTSLSNTPTDQPAGSTIANSNGATQMAWTTSASWVVPVDTVSGLFVAAVKDTGGTVRSWIPFVVRNDSRDADVVVKVSDSTWGAAYNYFGDVGSEKSGKDVYGIGAIGNIGDRSYAVSYDRPIVSRGGGTAAVINHWDSHEWALIDWLEENGVDVKYIGSYDLDQQDVVDVLGASKVFISAGHDEYWSDGMRDNLAAWRDTGKHLLFMSGNEVFWRIRWFPDGRGFWCYKDTMPGPGGHIAGDPLDPVSWTGTFRDNRRPGGPVAESLLTGTYFRMNNEDSIGRAMVVDGAVYGSIPFWRDTTVALGNTLTTGAGIIGFEADEVRPRDSGYDTFAGMDLTLSGSYADDNGQNYSGTGDITWGIVAVYMSATAGLTVGFGTCQWMWGLSDRHDRGGNVQELAMRQATMNLLYDLGATAPTIQTDLVEPTPVALATYGVTYTGEDPEAPVAGADGSIWQPELPGTVNDGFGDPGPVMLATRFTVSTDGHITKIWLYKSDPVNRDPITVFLFNATTETMMTSFGFNPGTATGWVSADLPVPMNVAADGTVYGVGFQATGIDYGAVENVPAVTNGQINALAGGWYNYTASLTVPGGSLSTSNYLVDVSYVEGVYTPPLGNAGSIFYPTDQPGAIAASDANDIVLLTRFSVSVEGTVQRLYYYKAWTGDQSSLTVYLLDATNEVILGQTTVDWGTETGWVFADLPAAYTVSPGTVYGAGIVVPSTDQWTIEVGKLVTDQTNGSITALAPSTFKPNTNAPAVNGFSPATEGRFYFMDVAYVPAGGGEVQNLYLGGNQITKVYVGGPVTRLYRGSSLLLEEAP